MHRFLVIGVLALACLVLSAPAAAWTWPAEGAVLRPFGLGPDPYAGGQHRGVDVAGADGSPVRAPAAGTVTFAGSLPTHGRGITIQTEDGYAVTLVHLGTIGVARGGVVAEGAPVGTVGWSGTPEHAVPSVHLGIRRASEEEGYVDPLGLLPPRAAPAPSAEPPAATAPAPAPTPLPAPSPPPASPSAAPQPAVASAPTPIAPAPPPAASPHAAPTPGVLTPAPAVAAATAVSQPPAPPAPDAPGVRAADGGDASASTGMWIGSPQQGSTSPGRDSSPVRPVSRPESALVAPGFGATSVAAAKRQSAVASVRAGNAPAASGTSGGREVVPLAGDGAHTALSPGPPDRASRPAIVPGGGVARDEPEEVGRSASSTAGASAAEAAHRVDGSPAARRALGARTRAPAVWPPAPPVGEGAVPLGPILAAFVLGSILAVAGVRRGARRIAPDGAVLRHDADLLCELDPPHRARVYDRGRGRLRAPPAAARP